MVARSVGAACAPPEPRSSDEAGRRCRIEVVSVQQLVNGRLLRIVQQARPLRLQRVTARVERLRVLARGARKLGLVLLHALLGERAACAAVLVEGLLLRLLARSRRGGVGFTAGE